MARKRTLTLAEDRRARVPFAVVGALLMVTSASVIYVLQQESEADQVIDQGKIISKTESALQTEIQAAAQESLELAGEKPVTKTSNTPAGKALAAGGSGGVFKQYTKLRFYLTLQQKIHKIEQEHSQRFGGRNITVRIGLPETKYTTSSIRQSINRVSIQRNDKSSNTPVEKITLDVGTVPIIVYRHGEEIGRKEVDLQTKAESPVFDLHEKTEEFDRRLQGIEGKLYGPLYAITYGKGGIERVLGDIDDEQFFARIITLIEMKEFTNLLVRREQFNTFGTAASGSDDIAAGGGCLGTYYAARFTGAFTGEHIPPTEITCVLLREQVRQQQFTAGKTLPGRLNNMARNQTGNGVGSLDPLSRTGTFKRSAVARIAFRNVTGQSFSVPDNIDKVRERYRNNTNGSIMGAAVWGSGDSRNQVKGVIEDIYTVGSSVTDVYRTGDTLNASAERRVVNTGSIQVVNVEDGNRNGIEKRVTVELPVDIRETTETKTTTKSVTFGATIAVGPTASKWATVEERGIKNPYASSFYRYTVGGIDRYHPSFAGASNKAVGAVSTGSSSSSEIERVLANEINTSAIITQGRFKAAVADVVTSRGTVKHTEITTKPQRKQFRDWLKTELRKTHERVLSEDATVDLTTKQQLTKEDPFADLRLPQHKANELIYSGVGNKYPTAADKARAELRKRYIDTLHWYINETTRKRNEYVDRVTRKVGDKNASDSHINLSRHFDRIENARDFSVQDLMVPAENKAQKYRLNTEPDWLTEIPQDQTTISGVKPRGEIREDPESITHSSLAMRKLTPLPSPGFPIVPFPPWWYVSINQWSTDVKAEYASFAVKPYSTEKEVANTSYVRRPQPVPLEINGHYRRVGRVEALGFSADNYMVGIMPGYKPMKDGSLGIGDRIIDANFVVECTQSWPHVGVGHRQGGFGIRDPATCPSLGPWGDMIYQGANVFGFGGFRRNMRNRIRQKMRRMTGDRRTPLNRPRYRGPLIDRLFNWNAPLDRPWKRRLRSVARTIREDGRDLAVGRLVDVGLAARMDMEAYNKEIICPMDKPDRTGCDDNQLEVRTLNSDGDPVVVINSVRRTKGLDRSLVIDTRPESAAKSGIPQSVKSALEKTAKTQNSSGGKQVHYHVRKHNGEYKVKLQNGSIRDMSFLNSTPRLIQTSIDVIEPTPGGGNTAPLLAISYKGKRFFIAFDEQSTTVDWDHVKTQIGGPNTKVDVFIGSKTSHDAVSGSIAPRSAVVTTQQQNPNITCTPSGRIPTEIYISNAGDRHDYRVSEEWWLFGPSSSPTTHCEASTSPVP